MASSNKVLPRLKIAGSLNSGAYLAVPTCGICPPPTTRCPLPPRLSSFPGTTCPCGTPARRPRCLCVRGRARSRRYVVSTARYETNPNGAEFRGPGLACSRVCASWRAAESARFLACKQIFASWRAAARAQWSPRAPPVAFIVTHSPGVAHMPWLPIALARGLGVVPGLGLETLLLQIPRKSTRA
jgi:hypothetical protein